MYSQRLGTLPLEALGSGEFVAKQKAAKNNAFAFGHYLGSKLFSPVLVDVCVTDIDDCSLFVDYANSLTECQA